MENLFYDQKVTKTFDLKGIQGRKVKAAKLAQTSKTLFDGEWIEGWYSSSLNGSACADLSFARTTEDIDACPSALEGRA
jgi:hypothetical protein